MTEQSNNRRALWFICTPVGNSSTNFYTVCLMTLPRTMAQSAVKSKANIMAMEQSPSGTVMDRMDSSQPDPAQVIFRHDILPYYDRSCTAYDKRIEPVIQMEILWKWCPNIDSSCGRCKSRLKPFWKLTTTISSTITTGTYSGGFYMKLLKLLSTGLIKYFQDFCSWNCQTTKIFI